VELGVGEVSAREQRKNQAKRRNAVGEQQPKASRKKKARVNTIGYGAGNGQGSQEEKSRGS